VLVLGPDGGKSLPTAGRTGVDRNHDNTPI
jgi:hypothetical protein